MGGKKIFFTNGGRIFNNKIDFVILSKKSGGQKPLSKNGAYSEKPNE